MPKGKMTIIVGTRPEIIKMAPIVKALEDKSIPFVFVHCGQHYDYEMSLQFLEELDLPNPDYSFEIPAYPPTIQIARMLACCHDAIKRNNSSLILVEGDTNGVLASALAAIQLKVPIAHVEAGLRSFDLRMPEEHNRRLVDHISTMLFAPTLNARKNLENENVWGKIYVTGNTVIDAVIQFAPIAEEKSKITRNLKFKNFGLITLHRAENVDDPTVLRNIVEAIIESPIPFVFPIHPRTQSRLKKHKIGKKLSACRNVQTLPPLGYFDFLQLMKKCKVILTDSGGIQEEATAPVIRKPVLIVRVSTERPEAVKKGYAKVVGVQKEKILKALDLFLSRKCRIPRCSPYGNGDSAKKIVSTLEKDFNLS